MVVSCTPTPGSPRTAFTAAAPKSASEHLLAPTDLIEIKVFQEPDLTTSTRIPENGRIIMPMIGELPLAGMTVQAATGLIRDRLQTRFLANPQVTLTVVEPARKLFTILGQVQRPGTFRFPERETIDLIQAIGIAGGYTAIGDPTRVTVKRTVNGKPEVLKLDAKRMAVDTSTPIEIHSNDIITVGERLF